MENQVLEIVLKKQKETKGTWVYANDDSEIPSLYVKKAGVKALGNPNAIVITVKPFEEQEL